MVKQVTAEAVPIKVAAQMLGISENHAYREAARAGELAGVKVIRIGRKLVLPLSALQAVLHPAPLQKVNALSTHSQGQ